jgi:glycosyltransferase involved in cell wall biosynthesis
MRAIKKDLCILFYLPLDWDLLYFTAREFIKATAKEIYPNRVICIDRPGDPIVGLLKNKSRLLGSLPGNNLRYLTDNLIIFRPFYLINDFVGSWLPGVNRCQCLWLKTRLRQQDLLPREKKVITWLFSPIHWPFAGLFPAATVVYHPLDEHTVTLNGAPDLRGIKDEGRMLARCQAVFTLNEDLAERKRRWHRNVHCLGLGVDAELFSRALAPDLPVPEEIREIPRPRLGLVGNLRDWIDFPLVESLLQSRPDWSVIFIGPKDPSAAAAMEALGRFSNFFWLGPKPYDEVYRWLAGLDVGIIPYRETEFTRFVNPYKIYEYWAAGLPVVTTRIGGFQAKPDCLWVSDTAERFADQIAQALHGRGAAAKAQRLELARTHSWEGLARQALEILDRDP